jgi:hypothetical protein
MRDALSLAVSTMIGIPPGNVVWKGSFQEGSRVVGTRVVLQANSIKTTGWDEERREDPDALDDQVVNRCGQRSFTWTIQIECQNQGAVTTARVLADQIRVRLWRPSTLAIVNNANMAMGNILGTAERDFVDDGRMISWASVDVNVISVENDIDDSPGAGSWIGEALIDGTIKSGTDTISVSLDVKG